MNWYGTVVFYMGMFDAFVIMAGGLVASFVILLGWDAKQLWDRIFPAIFTIIGSNIAAAIILGATKWLIGG